MWSLFPRDYLLGAFAFFAAFALGGCVSPTQCVVSVEEVVVQTVSLPAPYSRVIATDMQGQIISEYIADGPVREDCEGFAFSALERRVHGPIPIIRTYPLGRPVRVRAPNLVATPLYTLDEASSLARR